MFYALSQIIWEMLSVVRRTDQFHLEWFVSWKTLKTEPEEFKCRREVAMEAQVDAMISLEWLNLSIFDSLSVVRLLQHMFHIIRLILRLCFAWIVAQRIHRQVFQNTGLS